MQQPAAADDQQDEGADERQDFKSISASEIIAAGPAVLLVGSQWRNGLRDGLGGYILHRCLKVLEIGYWILVTGCSILDTGSWLMTCAAFFTINYGAIVIKMTRSEFHHSSFFIRPSSFISGAGAKPVSA